MPSVPPPPPDTARAIAAYLSAHADADGRLALDPDNVEQDLARLVLGLMELLRQIMERQAIRRMENGTLTPAQEDELGTTLSQAETAILKVAAKFGLSARDLSIQLGPLGRTI